MHDVKNKLRLRFCEEFVIKFFSLHILCMYSIRINNIEVKLSLYAGSNFVLDQNQ